MEPVCWSSRCIKRATRIPVRGCVLGTPGGNQPVTREGDARADARRAYVVERKECGRRRQNVRVCDYCGRAQASTYGNGSARGYYKNGPARFNN